MADGKIVKMISFLHGIENLYILRILSAIRQEVLLTPCNHVVQVFDSSQWCRIAPTGEVTDVSNLILPLMAAIQSNKALAFSSTQRFSRSCSLILLNITDHFGTTELPTFRFPGYPHNDYHVITRVQKPHSAKMLRLKDLGSLTRKIHHAFHILHNDKTAEIFRSKSSGNDNFQLLSQISTTSTEPEIENPLRLGNYSVNLELCPLIMITCAACGQSGYEYFKRTGEWSDTYSAIVYELSVALNATVQFKSENSIPRLERDADGSWDDWLSPLTDGSAAIAAFQTYSDDGGNRLKEFHFAKPYTFESVIFITAQPKKVRQSNNSLGRLLSPLDLQVWMASCASILMLSAALEVVIHSKVFAKAFNLYFVNCDYISTETAMTPTQSESSSPAKTCKHLTLFEILKLLLGQGATIPENLTKNVAQIRFLFSIWLLVTIVLGSGYQSFMTSHIVAPKFTKPPETFAELAESNFKVYAILWKYLFKEHFEKLGTSYGQKLAATAEDVSYASPDVR